MTAVELFPLPSSLSVSMSLAEGLSAVQFPDPPAAVVMVSAATGNSAYVDEVVSVVGP